MTGARAYTTSPVYNWQYSLYPVSGNTRDWAYGELGIPAYVIELDGNDFFFTSCGLVPNIVNNMLPLLRYAASISDRPYMRVYGPDARSVAASPASLPSGGALTVTAQINDTQNGSQAIAAAELYLVRQGGPTPDDPVRPHLFMKTLRIFLLSCVAATSLAAAESIGGEAAARAARILASCVFAPTGCGSSGSG